ncbi:TKL protein kinase [Saprolegnia diclina VS20]|uniref:TKL protein kinase n=1 Tax=Saprolegnia diclina (strain VS20) TaxID=1156394 RepID=T0Q3U0_SAPDV|nr:TKL protein kinase [Saprolegnia diclina VS20]EQC29266.1 TKL protein kinase [Saprolegnia diclina VS20]|eukprot:XP_008617240.1 TKL protein kinase [Saprolegnia diclina VS20]
MMSSELQPKSRPPSLPSPSSPLAKERTWSESHVLAADDGHLRPVVGEDHVSDARLLYRKWRTGSGSATLLDSDLNFTPPRKSLTPPVDAPMASLALDSAPSPLSVDKFEMLPSIPEKHADLEARSQMLSNMFIAEDELAAHRPRGSSSGSSASSILSGSFGKSSHNESSNMKKSKSIQALSDLEKHNASFFPAAPKPSASGVQRGLKDSVMHDMCCAVAKQMVGDAYVPSSNGSKLVLNHLYVPVLENVQNHFKRLPARYALSVDPDDVPMHIRLLANQHRNPDDINLHAHYLKDDDGSVNTSTCEVVLVAKDRDSLLDAITRGLSSLKGSIMDADVMTTRDGVTLDRFIVRGSFVPDDRLAELKRRIVENLERSAQAAENSERERQRRLAQQAVPPPAPAPTSSTSITLDSDIKPEWQLSFSELHLGDAIGTGRSGQTFSGIWRGTFIAAKVINVSHHNQSLSDEILSEFYREVAVVSRLRHPNIVLFLGVAINPPKYCLVFEFMQSGALTDLIRQRKPTPIDFFRIAREIAMGMNYLHLCSIMHRDLKSGNVLLDAYGTVKISDFGLSCVLEIGHSSDLTAETGTYRWMAPEVIGHEPYSMKADVYSYGVILWEMIAKEQPFKGMSPIQAAFAVARQQMRPPFPKDTPESLMQLVETCWHQDPAQRPTFAQILDVLPAVRAQLTRRDYHGLNFVAPTPPTLTR